MKDGSMGDNTYGRLAMEVW